jgi:molecular chaperone HtpG
MLESKKDKFQLKRVDSDTMDKLIDTGESAESVLSDEELAKLKTFFEESVDAEKFEIRTSTLSPDDQFISITRSEFERRMSEMQGMQGMAMFGALPDKYIIGVNSNHSLSAKALKLDEKERESWVREAIDLAKLEQNLLKGEELSAFVQRQMKNL